MTASAPPTDAQHWFEQLYHELRRRARGELFRHEALSLGACTLVHEAWMQMDGRALAFSSQPELVAYAARVMRGIVIDHIRQRRSAKHGGDLQFVPLDSLAEIRAMPVAESLLLDEAINTLALKDAALAQLVELKFFGGLSFVDIAALRGVSERTVQRDWDKARMFLYATLKTP